MIEKCKSIKNLIKMTQFAANFCHIAEKIMVNGYTFRGSNSSIYFYLPSELGSTIKGKNSWSKFFPLIVDPLLEGLHYSGKKIGSHK